MMDVLLACFDSDFFVSVLIFLLTFLLIVYTTRRPANVPPGPPLWPIVGNLLSLGTQPLESLSKLREKYGDVIGIYIGSELNVFVNGYKAVYEVLLKKGSVFSKRPDTYFSKRLLQQPYIVFANDGIWKEHRNFALRSLHDLCFSNQMTCIEDRTSEELRFLIEKIENYSTPTDLKKDLNLSLGNIMLSIIFGERTTYDDKDFVWFMDHLSSSFKRFVSNKLIVACFPWLQHMRIDILGLKKQKENEANHITRIFEKYHKESTSSSTIGQRNCLVHMYKTEMKNSTFFGDHSLWRIVHELIAAGSETTSTTLHWILLYLVRNPKIQRKLHVEICEVIGKNKPPSVCQRQSMAYTEAVIMEGLRISHAVPFAVPHCSKRDTTINGCFIPENTVINVNLQSVLKDPNIFSDPEEFSPDRFFDQEGTGLKTVKELIPFSIGPRSCIGESLARINLFLYLTTLVQKFEFRIPENEEKPSTRGVLGLTYSPLPFKVDVIKRS